MNRKYLIPGKNWVLTTLILLVLILSGCHKEIESEVEVNEAGDLIQATPLSSYSATDIESILNAFGFDFPLEIEYSVNVVKIVYYTYDPAGDLVKASGALMIPNQLSYLSSICFHHGTETKRSQVASVNPLSTGEGFAGLIMASVGFLTFQPDYLGLGESGILHPYLFAKSYADASIDLLTAGRTYCIEEGITLNGDLYLGGYSEGGYASLAVQKEIEKQFSFEFEIIANAPQAGPYDLHETVKYLIGFDEYPEPTFLAYMVTAYNDVYGWNRLDDFFLDPYAGQVEQLFDGNHTKSEINNNLPEKISLLFKESFITGYLNGIETEFINAVKENTLLNWTPLAPVQFYHSNADEVVPYQNSLTALENLQAHGASEGTLVTIDGMKHAEAAITAISLMTVWFDSLRTAR